MESIYLGIVLFLFLLAIFDLVVGVSNDAVNFLGSAVGARAASFKWIMGVAAVGILCGAVMSNGMMDVARHGIFRPEQFYFQDIMCICLAVMAIDVILLDTFNTLGLVSGILLHRTSRRRPSGRKNQGLFWYTGR